MRCQKRSGDLDTMPESHRITRGFEHDVGEDKRRLDHDVGKDKGSNPGKCWRRVESGRVSEKGSGEYQERVEFG